MTAWPQGFLVISVAGLVPFVVYCVIVGVAKELKRWRFAALVITFAAGFAPYVIMSSLVYHGELDLLYYYIVWMIFSLFRKTNRNVLTLIAAVCGVVLAFPVWTFLRIQEDAIDFRSLRQIFGDEYAASVRISFYVILMLVAARLIKRTEFSEGAGRRAGS